MLFKKCLIVLFAICFVSNLSAEEKQAQKANTPAYNLHGEVDKTDIYAIPLDSSEEEQEEELEELEHPAKKK